MLLNVCPKFTFSFSCSLCCAALRFPPCSISRWLVAVVPQNFGALNSALVIVLSCSLLQNSKSCRNTISNQRHWLVTDCWKKHRYGSRLRHESLHSVFSWHQPHLCSEVDVFPIHFSCKMRITRAYSLYIPSCALVREKNLTCDTPNNSADVRPTHIVNILFHNQTH